LLPNSKIVVITKPQFKVKKVPSPKSILAISAIKHPMKVKLLPSPYGAGRNLSNIFKGLTFSMRAYGNSAFST